MDCENAREYLSAYIDDELNKKELKLLLGHLENCVDCQGELEELFSQKEKLAVLRAAPADPLPDRTFAQNVMAAIDREDALRSSRKMAISERLRSFFLSPFALPGYAARLSAAVIFALMVAAGWGLYSHTIRTSPPLLSVYELASQRVPAEKIKLTKWTRSDDAIVFHHLASSSAETVGAKPCLLEYAAYTPVSVNR